MKDGRYVCKLNWRQEDVYDITVDAKETEDSYIFTLVQDNSRFPDGHMKVLFDKKNRAIVKKKGGRHAVVNREDWFVIYPDRNGVPFLFELTEGGR